MLKKFTVILLSMITFSSFIMKSSVYGKEDIKRKTVYLTFDDGPTVITDDLLDTLKNCNVKATFFIVGKEITGREETLKRIYAEGHSIGLHTHSHNLRKIYSNDDNFINEMLITQKEIKDITGYSPNIIRYPGGSAKHLSENTLQKLHQNKFKVYDWNVSLEDGVNPNLSVDDLIKNSKKCSKKYENSIILLMHCNSNNKNTIKAIPSIVKYYRELGYSIEPITESTPEYYYKIRK